MSKTENLAKGFGRLDDTDITIHNPDNGTVIDVWGRNRGILTDQYPYYVSVSQEQQTVYKGCFENKELWNLHTSSNELSSFVALIHHR